MTEHRQEETFDRELSLRGILGFLIGLTAITLVLMALFVFVSRWLREDLTAQDVPPSPLAEAHVVELPPDPVLQSDPEQEMADLRAEQATILSSYAWVDREQGIVRIPIEEAMRRVAKQGVPSWTPAPEVESP